MDTRAQILEAHALGRALTERGVEHVRGQALIQVRRSMGMTRQPPPPCLDPDVAYFAPDSPLIAATRGSVCWMSMSVTRRPAIHVP